MSPIASGGRCAIDSPDMYMAITGATDRYSTWISISPSLGRGNSLSRSAKSLATGTPRGRAATVHWWLITVGRSRSGGRGPGDAINHDEVAVVIYEADFPADAPVLG